MQFFFSQRAIVSPPKTLTVLSKSPFIQAHIYSAVLRCTEVQTFCMKSRTLVHAHSVFTKRLHMRFQYSLNFMSLIIFPLSYKFWRERNSFTRLLNLSFAGSKYPLSHLLCVVSCFRSGLLLSLHCNFPCLSLYLLLRIHFVLPFVCSTAFLYIIIGGTLWRSWLRHCSTSRKVAGSIPDGVIGFFIDIILPANQWPWCWLSL